ncbi:MAG: phosphoglycerate kinase [Candidatus Bilamarchaeaceae archaeon]
MRKILDYDVNGKSILLRVDLNSPVVNGKVILNERISTHVKTMDKLSRRGARVIVLAHQGRKGEPDFVSLRQHAHYITNILGKNITFVPDLTGPKISNALKSAKNGDIILLENVRFLESEERESGEIVKMLTPLADYFVLDAMSVAHRAHASVVGFTKTLPSFYGPVLAEEVDAISKVMSANDVTFVLGGSKAGDSLGIIENWMRTKKRGRFLLGGALSLLFLKSKGFFLGASEEFLKKENLLEHLEDVRAICENENITLPHDVGVCVDGNRIEIPVGSITQGNVWDIGKKTAEHYAGIIANSSVVVMNGPMGVYEMKGFEIGTKIVLEAIANSKCFSLLGGGHTVSALEALKFDKKLFGYVSLSGKALIKYLCGEKLVALKALEDNEKNFMVK